MFHYIQTFQDSSIYTVVGLPSLPSAGQKADIGMSGVPYRSQSDRTELGTKCQTHSHSQGYKTLSSYLLSQNAQS